MTKIEHRHFIEYLNFLGKRYPRLVLPQEKLEQLKLFTDQKISQYLPLLYQKFELDGTYEENSFLNSLNPIKTEPEIIEAEELSLITPKRRDEKPMVTIPIETSSDSDFKEETKEAVLTAKAKARELADEAFEKYNELKSKYANEAAIERLKKQAEEKLVAIKGDATEALETSKIKAAELNTVKPRYKYNYRRIGLVVFLLLALAYTLFKFIAYQKLGYIYVLTDELLVRTSSDKNGEILGSMNLFGHAKGRDNKDVLTFAELKLYTNEKQGAFYKVITGDFPFLSYLLNLNNIGYVYAKYVTTDKTEQDTYQKIFKPIKDDYYELKSLEYAYRAIIVNAITTQSELKGLTLKGPCDMPPMNARNMPLRIGQYQNKDKTVFFVLVQLSDGNYYSIQGDGFYNALPARKIYLNQELMTIEGKFQNKDDFFVWESCDKTVFASAASPGDFENFWSK